MCACRFRAMETWCPLWGGLLRSTVWQHGYEVRLVWITLLALKDKDGYVYGSLGWLSDAAKVPKEECCKALAILAAPEADSKTKEFEGRRIEVVDGGWIILNHHKYIDKMREQRQDMRRAYQARKQREYRAKKKDRRPLPGESEYVDAVESGASQEELDSITDPDNYRP